VPARPLRLALVAGPDPGHAFPAAALAIRLAAAGHLPLLFTGARFAGRLGREPIGYALLPELTLPAGTPDDDFGTRLHMRAAQMAVPLAERLRAFRPDLVIADVLTGAGGLAAELAGVPWLELVPHLLHLPSRALPPPGSGLPLATGPGGRVRDAVLHRGHRGALALGVRQRAAARVRIGLPEAQPDPVLRLVATLPALEYPRPDWPAAAHVVGPLHWEPAETDLTPPAGRGPLLFAAGSTASSGRPGLLEATLAALPRLHAELGVRLAGTVLDSYGGALPDHAVIGEGRQAPLLEQASVAVLGGGHGGVSKALQLGVPVVLLPGGGDQREVAERVRWAGAGIAVRRPDPAELAAAVRTVLTDPAYREAARRVAQAPLPHDPVASVQAAAAMIVTGSEECAPPRQPAE
jgi:UDP:flavonoid glycosyltransferase YjiC (YdhE family)